MKAKKRTVQQISDEMIEIECDEEAAIRAIEEESLSEMAAEVLKKAEEKLLERAARRVLEMVRGGDRVQVARALKQEAERLKAQRATLIRGATQFMQQGLETEMQGLHPEPAQAVPAAPGSTPTGQ